MKDRGFSLFELLVVLILLSLSLALLLPPYPDSHGRWS